jgi:hypothetical protein
MNKMYKAISAIEQALDNARRMHRNSAEWDSQPVDNAFDSPTFEKVLIAEFNEAYALAEELGDILA